MSITPGRVHNQAARVLADGFSEGGGTLLGDDVAPALLAWHAGVDHLVGDRRINQLRNDDLSVESRLALEVL
jgi:hypothetical protein